MPLVAVLQADSDLEDDVPADDRLLARSQLRVPEHRPRAGRWSPQGPEHYGDQVTALLVLEGCLTVDIEIGTRGVSMLAGPGDVLEPWGSVDEIPALETRWTVSAGASLAALDAAFTAATQRWPHLAVRLQQRLGGQLRRAMIHAALLGLPSVEQRLIGMLWLLADRWGRVTPAGVVMTLPLTHDDLARLVGARRPTVTTALGRLREGGDVTRRRDRSWLLSAGSRTLLFGGADSESAIARPRWPVTGRA